MAAVVGTGLAITFSSGFLAEMFDFQHSGLNRASIPTSTFATTGGMTFLPGSLYDPGEISGQIHHDPAALPPIGSAIETVTVTYPDSGAATWAADGFLMEYEQTAELEDRIVANVTIKLSGSITVTP